MICRYALKIICKELQNHNSVVAILYGKKKKKRIHSTSFAEICTFIADMRI